MIKKFIPVTFFVLCFYACKKDNTTGVDLSARDNNAFAAYETHFLEALWKLDPSWATMEGYHKYDSLMVAPTPASRDAIITFTKVQMDSLAKYNAGVLSDASKRLMNGTLAPITR